MSLICIRVYWLVLMCAESDQAVVVQKDFQRLTAQHEYVKSHVVFQPFNQVWMLHVLLHDKYFILWNRVDVVGNEDAFALAAAVGLDDHWEARLIVHSFKIYIRLPLVFWSFFLVRASCDSFNFFYFGMLDGN